MSTSQEQIVTNIENLQKQQENLDLTIQYMLDNQRLPEGKTAEEEFLNRVEAPDYRQKIEELEQRKQEIETTRKAWEQELKRFEVFEPARITYEQLTAEKTKKTREQVHDLEKRFTQLRFQLKTRLKFRSEDDEKVKEYRKELTLLQSKLAKVQELPRVAGAKLGIKKSYEGPSLENKASFIRAEVLNTQTLHPELDRGEVFSRALKKYREQFPKAIDPGGKPSVQYENVDLSIDWNTSTLIDPKTGNRRKMTPEERDEYENYRQIVHTSKQGRAKLREHAPLQAYFNTSSVRLKNRMEEERKEMKRLGLLDDAKSILPNIRRGTVKEITGFTEKNTPTPEQLKEYPTLKEINERKEIALGAWTVAKARKDAVDPRGEGGLSESGAIVETPFVQYMRNLTLLASMGTVRALRSISKVTDDPNKPSSDFGMFELSREAPTILLPPEQGGLTNPEADSAAVATMPMFMEFNKYYPKQQSSPAYIYGTGALAFASDIFIPVGPDAALIAMTPFTGGGSVIGLGATKTTKLGAGIARGISKGIRYTPSPRTKAILLATNDIIEKADFVFETTTSLGMSPINRNAWKGVKNRYALTQANKVLEAAKIDKLSNKDIFDVGVSDTGMVNILSSPQTIRRKAGDAVAARISNSIELQADIRRARSLEEIQRINERAFEGSIAHKVSSEILASGKLDLKKVNGLFDEAVKQAAKEIPDDAIRQAMFFGQRIGRVTSSEDILKLSTTAWDEAFKNNVYTRYLLKSDSLNQSVRNQISKLDDTPAIIDNFVDELVAKVAKEDPQIIKDASKDVIADMVSERLYSRAPNDAVFFTKSLLVDKRIASNPKFQKNVKSAMDEYVNKMETIDVGYANAGDVSFGPNSTKVLNTLIEEVGPIMFRRSPVWKNIAKTLMDDGAFNMRDYLTIVDSLKSNVAKKILRKQGSVGQTVKYTSQLGYDVGTKAFIREGTGFVTKMSAIKQLLRPTELIDEALPFYKFKNDLKEMTGSEFNNLVKELRKYPKKTKSNVIFNDVLIKTEKQYEGQITKEIRSLWDSMRPWEGTGFKNFEVLETSRIRPFIKMHPVLKTMDEASIVKLEAEASDLGGVEFDDLIDALDIRKSYKSKFIDDFLTKFFEETKIKPPTINDDIANISKELSNEPLTVDVFTKGIQKLREMYPKKFGESGLARFKPLKGLTKASLKAVWEDAIEDLILAQVVKKRASIKFDNKIQRLFEENPWIKTDIIGNTQSGVINNVKWKASQAGSNISTGLQTEIRAGLKDSKDVEEQLFRTEDGQYIDPQIKSFINNTKEAFKGLEIHYGKPEVMNEVTKNLSIAVMKDGYGGLKDAIKKEIKSNASYTNRIDDALNSLEKGIKNSIIKVERTKIEKQLEIDTIPTEVRAAREAEYKDLFKPVKVKNAATRKQIKKRIDEELAKDKLNAMKKIGINPKLTAKARKDGMEQVQGNMNVLMDEQKAYRKTELKDQNTLYSLRRERLDLEYELDTLSREERKNRTAARKQKENEWQADELMKRNERLTEKSIELKEKLKLPSRPKAMTPEDYAARQKELRIRERAYNKETFLGKEHVRRAELKRIIEDTFEVKATDKIEDLITKEINQLENEIEELHRSQRKTKTPTIKAEYPDKWQSKLYRYNLHKFIEKWDLLDDIIINKYITNYFKEVKSTDEAFALQDRIRTEISDWDANWKGDRAFSRIGVMNEARIDLGLNPLLDPKSYASKMKQYRTELKAFKKSESIAYKEAKKRQRVVFNKEVGIREKLNPKLKKERTLLRNEELKELRKQHLTTREATRAAQKEQRTIQRWEFYKDAGIPKPQPKAELKAKREQLSETMEGIEAERKASKEQAYEKLAQKQKKTREEIRLKVGLRPEKTTEEWFVARKELNRRLKKVDVSEGGKIQKSISNRIEAMKNDSDVLHPIYRAGDEIINNLQSRGVNVFQADDVVAVLEDTLGLRINEFNKLNAQAMFGKEFSETWRKATENLTNGSFGKSLEALNGRDVNKVGFFARYAGDGLRQITVGGLLGGYGTFRYAGLNALSAPFMMAMTRGVVGTAEDLGMGAYNLARRLEPNDVMFKDVNGLKWTKKQMDELESRYPLAASQAGAELDNSNLRYLMEIINNKDTGGGFLKLLHGASPFSARNHVARFADFTDSYFRRLVFRNGIRRGLQPTAAAREAKDALFDYQKARTMKPDVNGIKGLELERMIGQVMFFWSFQRESYRSVIDAVASGKAKQLLHSYRAMSTLFHDEEAKISGSNYDTSRLFRYMNKDFEGKKGVTGGFAVPAFESMAVMAEGIAFALALVQPDLHGPAFDRITKSVIERKPFIPVINLVMEEFRNAIEEETKTGFYVNNYIVSGMPDWAWPLFKERYNVVPVPIEKRRGNKASRVNEEGHPQHWKFKTRRDQKAYKRDEQILMMMGVKRFIDDNIYKSTAIYQKSIPGGNEPYPYAANGGFMELLLFQAAMKTSLGYTEPEERIERMQKRKEAGIRSQAPK